MSSGSPAGPLHGSDRRRLGERRTGVDRRDAAAANGFAPRQTLDWRAGRDRRGGRRRRYDPLADARRNRLSTAGSSLADFLASEGLLLVIVLALALMSLILGRTAY